MATARRSRCPAAGRRGGLLAALTAIAVLSIAAGGWAAASGPSPLRHDLLRIDGPLRIAIEYGPVELTEGLISSETVCRLAARTEQRGDLAAANAEWTTLARLVDEVGRPPASRIDSAFRRADSRLRALREKYAGAWSDPARIRQLRKGVADARIGIRAMGAAMKRIEGSFDAWNSHQCSAATAAIEAGSARLPAGLGKINSGMRRLWALTESGSAT